MRLLLARAREDVYHLGVRALVERLGPGYWWSDPTTPWDTTAVVAFAVSLALAFVGGVTVWVLVERIAPADQAARRFVRSAAASAFAFSAGGLVLLLFRWQMTPLFSRRIWFMLWGMGLIWTVVTALVRWSRTGRTTPRRSLPNILNQRQ
jgi:hypothetical protein